MIVVVDNYDSFTYNLVQQIERLAGEALHVVRNDAFDPDQLIASKPDAISWSGSKESLRTTCSSSPARRSICWTRL